MKRVFSRLVETIFLSDLGERDLLGEEIDSENVMDTHRVREIASAATTVFEGRSNAPTNFTMLTKSSARIGSDVRNNLGAERSHWTAIEITMATKRGMG